MKTGIFDPRTFDPPHKVTRPEQVDQIADDMLTNGWHGVQLVAYQLEDGTLQLLSGTHRQAAAIKVGLKIPVIIYPIEVVRKAWGNDGWFVLLNSGSHTRCFEKL